MIFNLKKIMNPNLNTGLAYKRFEIFESKVRNVVYSIFKVFQNLELPDPITD